MRARFAFFPLGLMLLGQAAWAGASCTFTVQPDATRPVLTGQLAFESCNNVSCESSAIYLSDLHGPPVRIVQDGWGIGRALNPVFSPAGDALLFFGVNTTRRRKQYDLYYWPIGSDAPATLTTPQANDQDPKFSADAKHVVWKRDFGISTAVLSFDGGIPSLSRRKIRVVGFRGTASEASGPVFGAGAGKIYYFTGHGLDEKLMVFDPVNASRYLFEPQPDGTPFYYPVELDAHTLLYVSHPQDSAHDKIYRFSKAAGMSTGWNLADCGADNSDPAPVDGDLFVYSRNPGDRYTLYLGQFSTGYSWSLDSLHLNGDTGNRKGANYTAVPPQSGGFVRR